MGTHPIPRHHRFQNLMLTTCFTIKGKFKTILSLYKLGWLWNTGDRQLSVIAPWYESSANYVKYTNWNYYTCRLIYTSLKYRIFISKFVCTCNSVSRIEWPAPWKFNPEQKQFKSCNYIATANQLFFSHSGVSLVVAMQLQLLLGRTNILACPT